MSNQSIIEHKANMFYVEFREDYLTLCLNCTYRKPVKGKEKSKASAYCKSLILSISEGWTNDKRGKGADLSFYMTYPQWIESMYGMFGRNVVIDSVDGLIGEGLLHREPVKFKGKDTFRYTLNYTEINRRMKELDDRVPYNTRPLVNALKSKRDESSTGLLVNGMAVTSKRDTGLLVNGNGLKSKRNIESTYHPSTESAQNTESVYSDDTAPAASDANASTPHDVSQFVFQVQGYERFWYHDFCIHEGDRGINDGLTLVLKKLGDVPQDAECSICYKPIHGPHGYYELPEPDEPYQPDFSASQVPAIRELSPVTGEAIEHVEEQRAALATAQDSVADENETHSQFSTCAVEKPRRTSAKVETAKPRQSRKKAEPHALEFTVEGRKVYDAWCSLFKSPPRTAEKTVDCANDLYARLVPWCQELHLPCKDLLKEIKGWLYATDPDWYRRKGVTLCDIGSKFENWQSAKEESLSNPEPPPAPRTSGKFRQESKPKDPGTVEWWDQQTGVKRLMTYAEADENGWNGGFGEFIQHTHYGRTIV